MNSFPIFLLALALFVGLGCSSGSKKSWSTAAQASRETISQHYENAPIGPTHRPRESDYDYAIKLTEDKKKLTQRYTALKDVESLLKSKIQASEKRRKEILAHLKEIIVYLKATEAENIELQEFVSSRSSLSYDSDYRYALKLVEDHERLSKRLQNLDSNGNQLNREAIFLQRQREDIVRNIRKVLNAGRLTTQKKQQIQNLLNQYANLK